MIQRLLALDYGSSRIGVAVSDPLGNSALPLPFIKHTNEVLILNSISNYIQNYNIQTLIVGLPKSLKGTNTQQTDYVLAFIDILQKNINIPILTWDERLSTIAAKKQLHSLQIPSKKHRSLIDSYSAAFILEGYMKKHPPF